MYLPLRPTVLDTRAASYGPLWALVLSTHKCKEGVPRGAEGWATGAGAEDVSCTGGCVLPSRLSHARASHVTDRLRSGSYPNTGL